MQVLAAKPQFTALGAQFCGAGMPCAHSYPFLAEQPVIRSDSGLKLCRWCAAWAATECDAAQEANMASPVPAPVIGALVEPTYSAREAATLLGRSYSWLDRRVRQGHFVRPDGTTVEPFRTAGGYRYFSGEMLKDVAECCYRKPLVLDRQSPVRFSGDPERRVPGHRRLRDSELTDLSVRLSAGSKRVGPVAAQSYHPDWSAASPAGSAASRLG